VGPRHQARRLAAELLPLHGLDHGRRSFLDAMGRPPYSTALGSAETLRIWASALPKPPKAPVKTWNPPAFVRDREQLVKSLVEYGLRPASLADAALQLIEAGTMDREAAIAWAGGEYALAIRSGGAHREPWTQEAKKLVAKTRR